MAQIEFHTDHKQRDYFHERIKEWRCFQHMQHKINLRDWKIITFLIKNAFQVLDLLVGARLSILPQTNPESSNVKGIDLCRGENRRIFDCFFQVIDLNNLVHFNYFCTVI